MSVLTLLQEVTNRIGVAMSSGVVGSGATERQLVALLQAEGESLRSRAMWPELVRDYQVTLVEGQDSYALPGDFLRFVANTQWDNANYWPLNGPLSGAEWQMQRKGIPGAIVHKQFRCKGFSDNQFFIFSTPDADDAGHIVSFEYYSRSWLRPKAWTAGATIAAGAWCSYNGNFYTAGSGGTAGATPPTHTAGTVSDGAIDWTFTTQAYESVMSNDDCVVLPADVVKLGVEWRYKRAKGLPYQDIYMEHGALVRSRAASLSGAPVINLAGMLRAHSLVPETGFGV